MSDIPSSVRRPRQGVTRTILGVFLVILVVLLALHWDWVRTRFTADIDELNGRVELKVGQSVTVRAGRNHGSVGIWQEVTGQPDTSVATVNMVTVQNNPWNVVPGGDNGGDFLTITAVAPGETSVRVVECFRALPAEDGACYDGDTKLPEHTVQIVVR